MGRTRTVFIAHVEEDLELAEKLENPLEALEVETYIEEKRATYGLPLPEAVGGGIKMSQILVPLLTQNSYRSPWVNQEIGYAIALGKEIIPLKEEGVPLKGFIQNRKYIPLRQDNFDRTIHELLISLIGWYDIATITTKCPECTTISGIPFSDKFFENCIKENSVFCIRCEGCKREYDVSPLTFTTIKKD